jgi:hypothetical protein
MLGVLVDDVWYSGVSWLPVTLSASATRRANDLIGHVTLLMALWNSADPMTSFFWLSMVKVTPSACRRASSGDVFGRMDFFPEGYIPDPKLNCLAPLSWA